MVLGLLHLKHLQLPWRRRRCNLPNLHSRLPTLHCVVTQRTSIWCTLAVKVW